MPARTAFAEYQSIRRRLPPASAAGRKAREIADLLTIADGFDTFFFDAFGVLNIGQAAVPGAPEVVAELQRRGKQCLIVSNAAGFAKPFQVAKFARFGYHFPAQDIVTSRDAVLEGLQRYPQAMRWGVIGARHHQEDLAAHGINWVDQDAPGFSAADGFLFFSPLRWNEARQNAFTDLLGADARPLLLGNPDLIAPMGEHTSVEAGSYVLLLEEALFAHVVVFGKPFPSIFAIAARRLADRGTPITPARTLMLGDTLHTDILGASGFGIKTALVTGHGFFNGLDYRAAIAASGIGPDYLLPSI